MNSFQKIILSVRLLLIAFLTKKFGGSELLRDLRIINIKQALDEPECQKL